MTSVAVHRLGCVPGCCSTFLWHQVLMSAAYGMWFHSVAGCCGGDLLSCSAARSARNLDRICVPQADISA